MSRRSIVYALDADDHLVAISPSWDAFARANDAPDLTRVTVLGRSLWDFIADDSTRTLYRAVLKDVRAGHRIELAIRCDSPDTQRHVALRLKASLTGVVTCHSFIAEERSQASIVPLWNRAVPRGTAVIHACSWCKRVYFGGRWCEADALDWTALHTLPNVSHGMCPTCEAEVMARLSR